MNENEDDFNKQLQNYIKKYPKMILEHVENEHGLNSISDYIKGKKAKLRKKYITGNTRYSIAMQFYSLKVFHGYSYSGAVRQIVDEFDYSNASGVESHLQNFKKTMLKEKLDERSGSAINDFLYSFMAQIFNGYSNLTDISKDKLGNAILQDLKKWYKQKELELPLQYYRDENSIPF
jgi:hypothetical protein